MNEEDSKKIEEDRRLIFKLIRDVAEREQQNSLKKENEIKIIQKNLNVIQEEIDEIWRKIEK